MSKLIKRIHKGDKNPENCLVIGTVWGEFPRVIECFRNVFVKKTDKPYIRARNVIVRDEFTEMALFSQIKYVFIDEDCLEHLQSVEKVFTYFSPLIYIGYGEFLNKEYSKYLNLLSYEIVEIRKEYQIWKRRK